MSDLIAARVQHTGMPNAGTHKRTDGGAYFSADRCPDRCSYKHTDCCTDSSAD